MIYIKIAYLSNFRREKQSMFLETLRLLFIVYQAFIMIILGHKYEQ